MKNSFKLLSLLAICVFGLALYSCSDKEDKEPYQLPDAAQVFIADYFGGGSITKVVYNKDDKNYDVSLDNGFELTFDEAGNWTDVDAPAGKTIPDGIAPEPIQTYVNTNYPDDGINEIEKTKSQYEVELTNGTDLYFTLTGEFISTDPD